MSLQILSNLSQEGSRSREAPAWGQYVCAPFRSMITEAPIPFKQSKDEPADEMIGDWGEGQFSNRLVGTEAQSLKVLMYAGAGKVDSTATLDCVDAPVAAEARHGTGLSVANGLGVTHKVIDPFHVLLFVGGLYNGDCASVASQRSIGTNEAEDLGLGWGVDNGEESLVNKGSGTEATFVGETDPVKAQIFGHGKLAHSEAFRQTKDGLNCGGGLGCGDDGINRVDRKWKGHIPYIHLHVISHGSMRP